MTKLEVISDAIKIGLPSLCTAVVAFLIAKFTRSHDFEKERRRRKQDFLERAAEPLDELTMRMESLLSSEETARSVDEQVKLKAQELLLKELELLEEAETKFGRIETKLLLVGFPECVEAFKAHQRCTIELKGAILARSQGREDRVAKSRDAWWESESRLRDQIVSAFRTL